MSTRTQTRRGADSFIKLSRNFEQDMAGCSLEEIGLMSLLLTSRMVTAAGVVYRRHEWAEMPESSNDRVIKTLDSLEAKGKIVQSHNDILIRSWIRWNCFEFPNMMKAVTYAVEHQTTTPLIRTVIATELLRKDIASVATAESKSASQETKKTGGRKYAKGQEAHYLALEKVWMALFDKGLPEAHTITGDASSPHPQMLDDILESDDFKESHDAIVEKNWQCIHGPIAEAIKERLSGSGNVTQLEHRKSKSS